MGFDTKFSLLSTLTKIALSPSKFDSVGDVKSAIDDADGEGIVSIIKSMSGEFPGLASPLLHERDVYLAWSLKRSKAVNGKALVVGVVGKGHLNGVVYTLMRDQGSLRFKDLVGRRRKDVRGVGLDLLRRLVVDYAIIVGSAWLASRLFGVHFPSWLTYPFSI